MSIFASAFTPISVSSAKENIASAEKFILFIGRPSCPYCQLLSLNYQMLHVSLNLIFFILIVKILMNLERFRLLRKRYGIATVPALFVSEKGAAKVVCDSSLSEEDILDFIS